MKRIKKVNSNCSNENLKKLIVSKNFKWNDLDVQRASSADRFPIQADKKLKPFAFKLCCFEVIFPARFYIHSYLTGIETSFPSHHSLHWTGTRLIGNRSHNWSHTLDTLFLHAMLFTRQGQDQLGIDPTTQSSCRANYDYTHIPLSHTFHMYLFSFTPCLSPDRDKTNWENIPQLSLTTEQTTCTPIFLPTTPFTV